MNSFSSVLAGVSIGYVVYKISRFRHIKPIIVVGTLLYFIATAIHVHFPGKSTSMDHSGIIGSQVLLGIGITPSQPHICHHAGYKDTNAIQRRDTLRTLP
jgi:hypothetical protein